MTTPAAAAATSAAAGRSTGLLHLAIPAIVALVALGTLASGRDLTQAFAGLAEDPVRPPLVAWVQRGVSLLLLLASIEQVANHVALKRPVPSFTLLLGFSTYWLCTVGLPMLFAANPAPSHEYVYSLLLGVAVCLVGEQERERLLLLARNALLLLMLGGLALVPLMTRLVLDTSYTQGLVPGLPRFAGLTAHPVTAGLLALVALLTLWARPLANKSLNRAAWLMTLGVLVLAQSKTTWLTLLVAGGAMLAVRRGPAFWQRVGDPRRSGFGVLIGLLAMLAVLGIAAFALLADLAGHAEDFAASEQGAQLMSLTGRDRIWAAAVEEWRNNPTFGYGLTLWDAAYRTSIGLPHATHAHNQFLDDLSRTGSVGAAALVVYALVLLALALRHARATGGLSVALLLVLAMRSISEVPLSLTGYGTEFIPHLLLLLTLASAAGARRQTRPRHAPLRRRYGAALPS